MFLCILSDLAAQAAGNIQVGVQTDPLEVTLFPPVQVKFVNEKTKEFKLHSSGLVTNSLNLGHLWRQNTKSVQRGRFVVQGPQSRATSKVGAGAAS